MMDTFLTSSETHLGSYETSTIELFRGNSEWLKAVYYFRKKGTIIDVWQGLKYAFAPPNKRQIEILS